MASTLMPIASVAVMVRVVVVVVMALALMRVEVAVILVPRCLPSSWGAPLLSSSVVLTR